MELIILEAHPDIFSVWGQVFLVGALEKKTTAQPTVEVKLIASTCAVNHIIRLRKMMKELGDEKTEATKIMCDNSSAVSISKKSSFSWSN